MPIRKCLKCFKRVPDQDGPCPSCGYFNASIANRVSTNLIVVVVLGVLAAAGFGVVYVSWKAASAGVDAVTSGFTYEMDLLLEVTGEDTETAEVYYTDEDINGHTVEKALLPWRMKLEDVEEGVIIDLSANPDASEGKAKVRIIDPETRSVLAEGDTIAGVAPSARASWMVREPK